MRWTWAARKGKMRPPANILLGRPSKAEDPVGMARFLASPASDYRTGQSLVVGGGMVLI